MLSDLNKDKNFEKLIKKHLIDILAHLFDTNIHFGILCRIDHVTFEPDLSDEIKADFRPLTLFFLAGFTFESAQITEDHLVFEAGFGAENFGALVSVPLLDIIQVILEETPIFVNSTSKATAEDRAPIINEANDDARESSLNALMSNPENLELMKKRKK